MTEQTKTESAMQKFRRTYPRADYYPDVDANKAIERFRRANPGKSTRVIIDTLVKAGAMAIFPESDHVSGK